VITPGEVIDEDVLAYLRTGVDAGMLVPDAADPTMKSVRVVAAS
jgi:arginine decarboxylase